MMMTDDDVIMKLEETIKDAAKHQTETLCTILENNAGVRYLQPYLQGCDAPVDAVTFRRAVPLSSYDDYVDYIHKLADGVNDDQPLLSVDPLICFFFSSGTSSMKPKLIPYFDSKPSKTISFLAHQSSSAMLRRLFPSRPKVNMVLWFIYAGNVTQTKGGYKAMAATSYNLHINSSNLSRLVSTCVSSKEVILGSDLQQQMYCHLLCGLRHYDLVDGIRAPYAAGLIRVFGLLETKWEKLCEDLENGFPGSEVTDVAMRESVKEVLGGPQPDLSSRIRSICEGKEWRGILSKLWPDVRYVKTVTTGSMVQYYPKLKHFAGELPILGGDYFASECCVAINLDIMQPPELTRYVMLPSAAYFEFLPFDSTIYSTTGGETVDISGIEVGQMYEVIVTTYRGLYRYRLGDIVKVVGYYNSSPVVELVMRAPKTTGEIITERDLLSAMARFQLAIRDEMAAEVTEFASFLNSGTDLKQLNVFIEVNEGCALLQEEKSPELLVVLRRCCSILEDGLGGIYEVMKARGEVGPLLVSIVKPGSFNNLLRLATENGSPASQHKPPKIIRNPEIADFMEQMAVVTV